MQIHIKCEGKTALGLNFGQVIEGLAEQRINPSQAMDLIRELDSDVDTCTMMYFLLGCTLLDSGADWVLLQPTERKYSEEVESKPIPVARQKRNKTTVGWVYLVKAEGLNQYKIGRSRTPEIRLRTLQTQSPVKLKLIHLIECADMMATELWLHKKFAEQRIKGTEWFVLADSDVSWFQSQAMFEEIS